MQEHCEILSKAQGTGGGLKLRPKKVIDITVKDTLDGNFLKSTYCTIKFVINNSESERIKNLQES